MNEFLKEVDLLKNRESKNIYYRNSLLKKITKSEFKEVVLEKNKLS